MSVKFKQLMDDESFRARQRGSSNGAITSWHQGYGLILEELDEFWDEVKKKSTKRDRANALKELVQIAALCERTATDLALVEDYERSQERAG